MQNLLQQPTPTVIKAINQVLDAIKEAAPIPAAHKRSLLHDIRDLSVLLTEERGAMGRPYWAAKNLFSAYIHYFLPWNLYRLGWLLPSLPLNLTAHNSLVDLGSGPLTLPLALWCAKPEWRGVPLRFLCTDVANQPMEQGLAIFNALTKNASPWEIECVKAPIETALAKLSGPVDCIMAGNVLNELQPAKGQTLQERIGGIVHSCSRKLKENGSMVFVEPGTRLGGKVVIMAREAGRELGLPVLAPCTHQEQCPLAKDFDRVASRASRDDGRNDGLSDNRNDSRGYGRPRGSQMASQTNMWCHFSFPVQGAPARLSRLTAAAKFDRRNLALSCVMMSAGAEGRVHNLPDFSDLEYLDDLEALYDETMREDEGGSRSGQRSGSGQSRHGRISDDRTGDRTGGRGGAPHEKNGWAKAKYFEGLEAVVEGTLKPPLWTRIISGPIRLPKEGLPARYGCSATGLVLVRRCERIPYGAAVEVTWERLSRDEKSGALMVDMLLPDESEMAEHGGGKGFRSDSGSFAGRTDGRGKRIHPMNKRRAGEGSTGTGSERTGRSHDSERAAREGDLPASEKRRKPTGPGRNRDVQPPVRKRAGKGDEGQSQVSDFQSFFGRPQKMRERYGGLPQSLRNPHNSDNSGNPHNPHSSGNLGNPNSSHTSQKSSRAYAPQDTRDGGGSHTSHEGHEAHTPRSAREDRDIRDSHKRDAHNKRDAKRSPQSNHKEYNGHREGKNNREGRSDRDDRNAKDERGDR